MPLRLNGKTITDFILNGKSVNRMMLNDIQIWPDEDIGTEKIEVKVKFKQNGYKCFCIEALEMFNEQYSKIEFDNIERIGNPYTSAEPNNFEAVLEYEDSLAMIKSNAGIYGVANIPAKITSEDRYQIYGFSWLPDNVCTWHNFPNETYIGYRHYLTYNNLVNDQEYSITFSSEGNNVVKYVALSFGYSYNMNALTYEVLQIKHGNNYILNCADKQELNSHDVGYYQTDQYKTYGSRYLLGMDGSINKYWHLNYYQSNSPYLFQNYICKQWYLVNENNADDKILVTDNMVLTTIEDIVNNSDHNGHIIIEKPKKTDINFTIEKTISTPDAYPRLSSLLLYDPNGNLINSDSTEWSSVLSYNGSINNKKSVATGFLNNDEDLISIHCSVGQYNGSYTPLQTLGIPIETINSSDYNRVLYTGPSISTSGYTADFRLLSNLEVRYISIPMMKVCDTATTEGFNKLTINGNIIKEYMSNESSLFRSSEVKAPNNNDIYVRRYTYDVQTGDVFVSYVKANTDIDTINQFRKHYVFDTFTDTFKEITFDELLTGNYPEGEFDSMAAFDKFTFAFSGPIYSTPIKYTAMQYLQILKRDGSIYATKNKVIKEATINNNIPFKDHCSIELTNGETTTIAIDGGVHSSGYLLSYVMNNDGHVYLSGINSSDEVDIGTVERRVTIYLPKEQLLVLFTPFWAYTSNYPHYTSCKKLTYDNNNGQICKDYESWSDSSREVKVVKGVTYYRRILATTEKAYIVWTKSVNATTPLYKYNEEYDIMVDYTIENIILKDLVEEDDTDISSELSNLQSDIRWYHAAKYANNNVNYFSLCNGMMYLENEETGVDEDGNELSKFKLVDPNTFTCMFYRRDTKFGEDENHPTAIIRFKDENGNTYDLSTDAGTHSNNNNYHIWNLVSNINLDSTVGYGYITWQPFPDKERLYRFRLQSTAKVKAFCFNYYYMYGYSASFFPYAHPGKMVYNNNVVYDYNSDTEAKANDYVEGMFARIIIFPDKNEVMKVRTPNNGKAAQTGVIQTPHYLWERNLQRYIEFTIDELYDFDKQVNEYDFETASFTYPRPEVNSLTFKVAKTFKFSTENYAQIGNCLLFDEDYNIIPLTWKSYTRNTTSDTAFDKLKYFCVWEDNQGNEFEIETNCFEYASSNTGEHAYSIANVLTPYYGDINTGTSRATTSGGPNSQWLSRQVAYSAPDTDGNPTKWGYIKFRAATRKIGAIGISEPYYYYSNNVYRYIFSHVLQTVDKDTEIPIWEYENAASSYTQPDGRFKIINSTGYFKRTIVLEDGTQYITWVRYRGMWNHTE